MSLEVIGMVLGNCGRNWAAPEEHWGSTGQLWEALVYPS